MLIKIAIIIFIVSNSAFKDKIEYFTLGQILQILQRFLCKFL